MDITFVIIMLAAIAYFAFTDWLAYKDRHTNEKHEKELQAKIAELNKKLADKVEE